MNRLILIGNGFDLAHKLKTRYSDFLYYYLKNVFEEYNKNGISEDILLSMGGKDVFSPKTHIETPPDVKVAINILDKIKKGSSYHSIRIEMHSELLIKSLENIVERNWVDIEDNYYRLLTKIINNKYNNKRTLESKVVQLNKELDFIKLKLKEYLRTLDYTIVNDNSKDIISELFCEYIYKDEVVSMKKKLVSDHLPNELLFLNFNYTRTLNHYIENVSKKIFENQIISIHGEINNSDNPIIFGFGDEIDKEYKTLEDLNENEYLRHMKSFGYFKTTNYHKLISFTNYSPFQVYILGHSCGLSDRTMLNQIFEHDNCKSIKIFYYQKEDGSDDYVEKTHEMSRHFKNKISMREKIIPKQKSRKLPKIVNEEII